MQEKKNIQKLACKMWCTRIWTCKVLLLNQVSLPLRQSLVDVYRELLLLFSPQSVCWGKNIKNYVRISNCSNKVGWRNNQNKSYRSRWVVQLWCCWLFHLKSFTAPKFCLKFSNFEIQIFKLFKRTHMEKGPKSKL